MRLRAEIVVDMEAEDYIAAAEHQSRLRALFNDLKAAYSQASLEFRQLRAHAQPAGAARPQRQPGERRRYLDENVSVYED
jgi:hypothetical protein